MAVDVSDFERVAKFFDTAPDRLAQECETAIDSAADLGIQVAKAWAPERSGDLRRGIERLPKRGSSGRGGISGGFRASEYYSWFVEGGTAFQRPQRFMERGRAAAEPEFRRQLDSAVDRTFNGL